jgi:hypothetical protein
MSLVRNIEAAITNRNVCNMVKAMRYCEILVSTGLHDVISQNVVLLIVGAERGSDLASWCTSSGVCPHFCVMNAKTGRPAILAGNVTQYVSLVCTLSIRSEQTLVRKFPNAGVENTI